MTDLRNTERVYALGAFSSPMLHLLNTTGTFTRSDGSIVSRIYERLTKASRRRVHTMLDGWTNADREDAYRQGVKDTLEAVRNELT